MEADKEMRAHLAYLKYVLRHKWFVLLECWRWGLIWQGIVHDLSKFGRTEWGPYVHNFYNPDGSRRKQDGQHEPAFDRAWLHHIHANPHHWQHWVLREDGGATKCLEMPEHLLLEMVADWTGAGRAIHGRRDVAEWYERNREHIMLHPTTRVHVEWLMGVMEDEYAVRTGQ